MASVGIVPWFQERVSAFGGQLLFNEPLSKHTYYRIGGPASVLAIPRSKDDLRMIAAAVQGTRTPWFILGLGTNLLVSDSGFNGLVIKTGRLDLTIQHDPETRRLRTGVSVAISSLLRRASSEGWAGLEFLAGIPGSVGGAVYMNGGTHLGESSNRLRRVETFDLETGAENAYEAGQLQFEYRKNRFLKPGELVCAAEWEVERGDPATVRQAIDSTLARRKATQPIDFPSCGSVFKNPRAHGMEAWQVVEKLGLRGHRIGGAQISEKHSNWIVNLGGASAADVRALIELVKSRAQAELGVPMEEEVRYLGF